MAYSEDLTVADSYSRLEHGLAQQRVKHRRDARAAAVGLPAPGGEGTSAALRPQPVPRWFELPNAAAHGNKNNVTAYPEQLWPTQSTRTIWRDGVDSSSTGHYKAPYLSFDSSGGMARPQSSGSLGSSSAFSFGEASARVVPSIGTREWGQRPWVMPLASFVKPSKHSALLSTMPVSRGLLSDSFNVAKSSSSPFNSDLGGSLPPLLTAASGHVDRDKAMERDAFRSRAAVTAASETGGNRNVVDTRAEQSEDVKIPQPQTGGPPSSDSSGGLRRGSPDVAPTSPTSPVYFQRAPRRPHFYALMDLSHEAHRERLHKVWPTIKAEFRRYPPHGVLVETELVPMLLRCGTSLSKEQLLSLVRQLPSEMHVKGARIAYFIFLEFFGLLEKDGTVVEPLPQKTKEPGESEELRKKSEGQWEEIPFSDIPVPDDGVFPSEPKDYNRAVDGGNGISTARAKLPDEIEDSDQADKANQALSSAAPEGVSAATASRFSTRVAMEWDSFKDEIGEGRLIGDSNTQTDVDVADENAAESHAIDLSLDEVRFLSAAAIQSAARGYVVRRKSRLRRALALCRKNQDATLRVVVRSWGDYTNRMNTLRDICRRPLHRLRRYMRGLARHRFMMTHCFWSFYVWRRYSAGRVFVRQKVTNLLEILNVAKKIHHFRAWARYYAAKKEKRRIAAVRRKHMEQWKCRHSINNWHPWAKHRAQLLKNWREKGAHLASRNAFTRKITWFAVWRYYTYLRLVVKERGSMYWLFEDKPHVLQPAAFPGAGAAASVVLGGELGQEGLQGGSESDSDRSAAPSVQDFFASDPIWLRELEPLQSIDAVCLRGILAPRNEAGSNDEDEDEDDEAIRATGRVLPTSVRMHIAKVARPMLEFYVRQDRNERAISYNRMRHYGPAVIAAFRAHVVKRRKNRYCVARGIHLRLKHALRDLKGNTDRCRRRRLQRGDPLPAVWLRMKKEREEELLDGLSLEEQQAMRAEWKEEGGPPGFTFRSPPGSPNENNKRRKSRSRKKKRTGSDSSPERQEGEGRANASVNSSTELQVELTLEARNRRRQEKIEEAKKEFEADVERRRNGFRHNEQLQKDVKELRVRILGDSSDKSLQHAISMEAIAAEVAIKKRRLIDIKNDTEEKRGYVLNHMESVKRRRARMLHDILCKVSNLSLSLPCLARPSSHSHVHAHSLTKPEHTPNTQLSGKIPHTNNYNR